MRATGLLVFLILGLVCFASCEEDQVKGARVLWKKVEKHLGTEGHIILKNQVLRFMLVRSDLGNLVVENKKILPEMLAAGCLDFFHLNKEKVLLLGKLPLREDNNEVEKVLQVLNDNNVKISGLNNLWRNEKPKLTFIHIESTGCAIKLAKVLKEVLSILNNPHHNLPENRMDLIKDNMDVKKVCSIFKGNKIVLGKTLLFEIPRDEHFTIQKWKDIPNEVGFKHIVKFFPTSLIEDEDDVDMEEEEEDVEEKKTDFNKVAVITKLALKSCEVNKVIPVLVKNGFKIDSLSNTMLNVRPNLFNLEACAKGDAIKLSKIINKVIDMIGSSKDME